MFRLIVLPISILCLASPASAFDGASAASSGDGEGANSGGPTYYEAALGTTSAPETESAMGGLPSGLHLVDAGGSVTYELREFGPELDRWEVQIVVAKRPHERVDAVYDLLLVLPLPANAQGAPSFRTNAVGIDAREGTENASVAFIYGDEKVVLKRNVALEKVWLPSLVGASNGLPDLSGTGYTQTLWGTLLRYDPARGDAIQGFATLAYEAPAGTPAPDETDPRLAAHIINWIPTIDPTIPPYTLRLDVGAP
jgi:hypothetical protein